MTVLLSIPVGVKSRAVERRSPSTISEDPTDSFSVEAALAASEGRKSHLIQPAGGIGLHPGRFRTFGDAEVPYDPLHL
jgi:hypothetical protein